MPKDTTVKLERVQFQFQLDAESEFEAGRFAGIASVFGSKVDTFPLRTKIAKGAFLRTINNDGNRVKILNQHDESTMFIGLPTKLQETDEGLLIEVSLNKTQAGIDAAEALRHAASLGKLDAVEMSIGFDAMDHALEEDEEGEMFRIVKEVRLWEVSLVNFGADRKTRVIEAASLDRRLFDHNSLEARALVALAEASQQFSALAAGTAEEEPAAVLRRTIEVLSDLTPPGSPPVAPTDEWRSHAELELAEAAAAAGIPLTD